MNKVKDNIATGLLCGFIAPALAFIIYVKIKQPHETLIDVVNEFIRLKIVTVILSFAAFINLVVFFAFIWVKADKSARGVLTATIIYAFAVIILKLTTT
jgi:hypothetical protein